MCAQVLLLPHAPGAPDPDAADAPSGGMVLLERWAFAHERAQPDGAHSPTAQRRPSLFESARSLEVPVIYKRTARAPPRAFGCRVHAPLTRARAHR